MSEPKDRNLHAAERIGDICVRFADEVEGVWIGGGVDLRGHMAEIRKAQLSAEAQLSAYKDTSAREGVIRELEAKLSAQSLALAEAIDILRLIRQDHLSSEGCEASTVQKVREYLER